MFARVAAAWALLAALAPSQLQAAQTCQSACAALQERCSTKQDCCPGTTCTPLKHGEGYSLCLRPFTPFGVSFNLQTTSYQTNPAVTPSAAVVFLHGYGMDKEIMRDYFFSLVSEVKGRKGFENGDHILFVFPDAPAFTATTLQLLIDIPQPARGWFDIVEGSITERMFGLPFKYVSKDVEEAGLYVQSVISGLVKSGIPACRIVLAGYSQGSAVALHAALTYDSELAGVAGMASFYVPTPQQPAFKDVPIFLAHGLYDAQVPYYAGQLTARALNSSTPGTSPFVAPIPAFLDLGMTSVTFKGYPIIADSPSSNPNNIEAKLSPFILQRNHTLGADEAFDVWNFFVANLPA